MIHIVVSVDGILTGIEGRITEQSDVVPHAPSMFNREEVWIIITKVDIVHPVVLNSTGIL